MPFPYITQLVHGGFNDAVDFIENTHDAAFKSSFGTFAIQRLRQGVGYVDGLATHVSDAEKNTAGFIRQLAFAQPGKITQHVVAVADHPCFRVNMMNDSLSVFDDMNLSVVAVSPDFEGSARI